MRQAAEHLAAAGGLAVAARYLQRAAELPPSNTSWYMGLSNGSAGLCAPLTILTFDVKHLPVAARYRYLKRFAQLPPSSCSRYMSQLRPASECLPPFALILTQVFPASKDAVESMQQSCHRAAGQQHDWYVGLLNGSAGRMGAPCTLSWMRVPPGIGSNAT